MKVKELLQSDVVVEGEVESNLTNNTLMLNAETNFLYWFKTKFNNIKKIEYYFKPLSDKGLAMIFFGADGLNGVDLFDDKLKKRNGDYPQYHSSDIKTFHSSYYRRKWESERLLHVANLRMSPGFYLVSQGPDPIPTYTGEINKKYKITIEVKGHSIYFSIDDLIIYAFPVESNISGYIGIRQMSPLVAEYSDLKVYYD